MAGADTVELRFVARREAPSSEPGQQQLGEGRAGPGMLGRAETRCAGGLPNPGGRDPVDERAGKQLLPFIDISPGVDERE